MSQFRLRWGLVVVVTIVSSVAMIEAIVRLVTEGQIVSDPEVSETPLIDRFMSSRPVKPVSIKKKQADLLPQSVINGMKKFVYFLGHPRSGHSIVASLLDAHPHIIIAHEDNVFKKVLQERHPYTRKSVMFNKLWKNSYNSFRQGHRSQTDNVKGYTLTIEGLYQGTYQSYVEVIGDKKAGRTTMLLAYNFTEWEKAHQRLKSIVDLPFKVFHCIRSPYDNIATLIIDNAVNFGSLNYTTIGKIRVGSENYTFDPDVIDHWIDLYFDYYQAIENVKFKLDMLQIHNHDLIMNPRETIKEMCDFLEVTCSNDYLDVCAEKVFKTSSKSRYRIVWEDYQLSKIKSHIKKFSSLQWYIEFDS